jgi:glyoxylase-like metal-dependent hydrolase (beta-lactamase superfamily II)
MRAGIGARSLFTVSCLLSFYACARDAASTVVTDAPATAAAPVASALAQVDGKLRSETHVFEEITPGVYFATGTGVVNLVSNAMVVVNDEDVLVVDSHITADAARGLIASIAALTPKPIRYLVNSHYHFDHTHGNQSFPPGVEIIGHEYTRDKLLGPVLTEKTYTTIGGPEAEQRQIAAFEEQLAKTEPGAARTNLEAQIAMLKRHLGALSEVKPTPPNLTLTNKVTLFRGGREIQLLHLGRGHTGGDVITFLPKEKIAFTGDLFYAGAAYLGDSFPEEFIATLEKLKQLDFDVLVPGHGPLVRDRQLIDFAQGYLRTYWNQVKASHAAGKTVAQAADALDLKGYEQWAGFQLSRREVLELEVSSMYELLSAGN